MGPMKGISQFVSFSFSARKCEHYSFLSQAKEPAFNKSALLLYGAGAHPSYLWVHYTVCGRFSSRKTYVSADSNRTDSEAKIHNNELPTRKKREVKRVEEFGSWPDMRKGK